MPYKSISIKQLIVCRCGRGVFLISNANADIINNQLDTRSVGFIVIACGKLYYTREFRPYID